MLPGDALTEGAITIKVLLLHCIVLYLIPVLYKKCLVHRLLMVSYCLKLSTGRAPIRTLA